MLGLEPLKLLFSILQLTRNERFHSYDLMIGETACDIDAQENQAKDFNIIF